MQNTARWIVLGVLMTTAMSSVDAGERIRRDPLTSEQEARQASETAMNDGLLQKGDIVVTDRGFLVFRGVREDGYTFDFATIPNPLPQARLAPPTPNQPKHA